MSHINEPNAETLGQILLIESMFVHLPDDASIFSFVCRGLQQIPGVSEIHYQSSHDSSDNDGNTVKLPIVIGKSSYGELQFEVSDADSFGIYQPYLENLCLMLAVVIDQRRQMDKIERCREELEQRVEERTNELQRSETQHRTLFESSADGILILDGDQFIDCNPAAIKLFGAASRDDLLAHHPWELSPPSQPELGDSKNAAQIVIKKVLDDGFNDFEWRYRRLDNQNDFVARVLLSRMEIDDRVLIQASISDITKSKQVEKSLKASEQRFRDISLASADWIWETDAKARFIYASDNVFALLGFRSEEIIGKTPFDLMPPDEAERVVEVYSTIAARKEAFSDLENINCHRDGSLCTVSTKGVPVLGGDGELLGYRGMNRDITERKRAEEFKSDQNRILELIAQGNASQEAVLEKIIQAAEKQFESVRATVLLLDGQIMRSGATASMPAAYNELTDGLTIGPSVGSCGTAMYRKERVIVEDVSIDPLWADFKHLGKEYGFRACWSQPIFNSSGKLLGCFAIYRKQPGKPTGNETELIGSMAKLAGIIIERKHADQALRRAQKMESIGQLTGGIAHDFNNILGIILGNLDLLKHQVTDDKALKRVETIKGSAQRAVDLTKQLLGFSRQQSTQRVRSDIRRVIREMESLIACSLTPEIAVEQQFAEDLWLTEIDPGDFQDALLNLAINARDAMPAGGQLTLEARNCSLDAAYCAQNPGATPGEYVQLVVSDNGMGISPENREKIFEPFFTTKSQNKSTGLGLAMVYGFTKRSKGYIQAYSEQDIGTTIRLYLPRAEGEKQPLASSAEPAEQLPWGRETILVVDDEEELLELAQETLQALGYRVLIASSGRQAMARLAEEPGIDLLFSDVVMPGGMNGYELAEQATHAYPQLKVLLTSGYTGKALAHNGQARFAANLLSKPYSQAELAQGVRTLLGESDVSEPNPGEPERALAHPSVASIEWTDALSIGVDAIDADHKTLLALLNRCQQDMTAKEPELEQEQEIHRILDELGDYVETHFQREEAVMAAVDYPGLENHRQVHQLLGKQVEKMRGLLKRGELTIDDLGDFLHSWLIDHIDNMDGAIKPYCEGKDDLIEQALQQAGIARKKEDQS